MPIVPTPDPTPQDHTAHNTAPDIPREDNPCDHHKHGDLCGDCGYGMEPDEFFDFAAY